MPVMHLNELRERPKRHFGDEIRAKIKLGDSCLGNFRPQRGMSNFSSAHNRRFFATGAATNLLTDKYRRDKAASGP